jgi:hypothetical protein
MLIYKLFGEEDAREKTPGRRPILEALAESKVGVTNKTGIHQPVGRLKDPGRGTEHLEMPFVVHIGAQQVYIFLFNEVFGQLQGVFAIVAAEGQEVQLEQAAGIP